MVRDIRVKDYRWANAIGNATTIEQVSDHSINGEILRIAAFPNFTGSVIVKESGTNLPICNYSVASGTSAIWTNLNFTVTTGSFTVNAPLIMTVGSLVSGTTNTFGPVVVYYR